MSLRAATIKLAHQNPELRKHLVPLLRTAMEHATEEARKNYLKEHPNADPKNHTVESKGDSGGAKTEAPISGKINKFFSGLKGIASSMVKVVSSAPAKVQSFVMDKDSRKETLTSVSESVKKSPQKVVTSIMAGAKKEVHEIKHAGKAMKKLLAKPREKWTTEDTKAVYGLSLYVVGAVMAGGGGGPIMAAGALAKSFTAHVAAQAMHRLANDGFTHFEAVESILHLVHASEDTGDEEDEDVYQQSMVGNLVSAVTKVLDSGISDDDMKSILEDKGEPDMSDFKQPSVKASKDKGEPDMSDFKQPSVKASKEGSLRSRVIRLAKENPELRVHLLPLVTKQAADVHVAIRDLPTTLQRALKEVDYNKRDIAIIAKHSVSPQGMGGDGSRSFISIVNLESGHTNVMYGSWGGANMNNPRNQVDLDSKDYMIPMNGAVIKGVEGGSRPTWAQVYVNPDNMSALLPMTTDTTAEEKKALEIIGTIKSSYRASEFEREGLGAYSSRNPLLQSLLKKGLISIRDGGGILITTLGKNAY